MTFKRILSGSEIGAVTGFVAGNDFKVYGLSAFHVLSGSNRTIDLYDIVKVKDTESGEWINFGSTIKGVYTRGYLENESNILDFAIFDIENNLMQVIKNALSPTNISDALTGNNQALINLKVYGYSVMNDKIITGKIVNAGELDYDISIQLDAGCTVERGDSGMLWKDLHDNAVAMHLAGNLPDYATVSYSCLINRILNGSGFDLYEYIEGEGHQLIS